MGSHAIVVGRNPLRVTTRAPVLGPVPGSAFDKGGPGRAPGSVVIEDDILVAPAPVAWIGGLVGPVRAQTAEAGLAGVDPSRASPQFGIDAAGIVTGREDTTGTTPPTAYRR